MGMLINECAPDEEPDSAEALERLCVCISLDSPCSLTIYGPREGPIGRKSRRRTRVWYTRVEDDCREPLASMTLEGRVSHDHVSYRRIPCAIYQSNTALAVSSHHEGDVERSNRVSYIIWEQAGRCVGGQVVDLRLVEPCRIPLVVVTRGST